MLLVASAGFACDSDDDDGSTGGNGSGGSAGSAGTGGSGGTAGSGGSAASGGVGGQGGADALTQFCEELCPPFFTCGQGAGGQGGYSSIWPESLNICLGWCPENFGDCTAVERALILGCMTPHIDPACDFGAFVGCVGSGAPCIQ